MNIWYACYEPQYVSQLGFVNPDDESAHFANYKNVIQPGDVYVRKHHSPMNFVETSLLKSDPPQKQDNIVSSWFPGIVNTYNMSINPEWIEKSKSLHAIMIDDIEKSMIHQIMDNIQSSQRLNMSFENLPSRGTWGYAVKTATSFKPQYSKQMKRMLLLPSGEMRPEFHKILCNQSNKNFVVCAAKSKLGKMDKIRAYRWSTLTLREFGYEQRVHIWDAVDLSLILAMHPHILSGVIKHWVKEVIS